MKHIAFTALLVTFVFSNSNLQAKTRIGLISVTTDSRSAKRMAKKLTRSWGRQLRRGYKVVYLPKRQANKHRLCVQQKDCFTDLVMTYRAKLFVIGYITKLTRKAYQVDYAFASTELGRVITSHSVMGSKRKILKSAAKAKQLVREAFQKEKELIAERKAQEAAAQNAVPANDMPIKDEEAAPVANPIIDTKKSEPVERPSFFSSHYWAGWTALSVSAVSLTTGIVFGAISSGNVSDAKAADNQIDAWVARDAGEKNSTVANIFLITAGVSAVTAGVLFYFAYKDAPEGESEAFRSKPIQFGVSYHPSGGFLSLSGEF